MYDEFRRFVDGLVWPHRACFLMADDAGSGGGGGDAGADSPAADSGDDAPLDQDSDQDWKQEALKREQRAKEAVQEAKKYRQRAQRAEQRLQEAEDKGLLVNEDELKELQRLRKEREDADRAKLEEEGKYRELIEQKDETHRKALAEKEANIGKLTDALQHYGAVNPLMSALSEAGVKDAATAAFVLQHRYKHRVVATLGDDNEVQASVVDARGEPIYDAEEEGAPPMTIAKLVRAWLATPQGAHFLPASADTGSGAHQGRAGRDTPTLAQLEANPELKAKFQRENREEYHKMLQADRMRKRRLRKEEREKKNA